LRRVLDDLAACLEHETDEGAAGEPVAPAVMSALSTPPSRSSGQTDLALQTGAAAARPAPNRSAPSSAESVHRELEAVAREAARCTACGLHASRTHSVPGQGSPRPEIVFVGEAPGADEDREGLAFIGRAGKLLTTMIEAMGFTRDEVFICNVVKCRPPDNRTPELAEMAACVHFLKRQIAALQPKVIVAMGATALNGLVELPPGMGISKVRGNWMSFGGADLMPTFHPAYLLRNPAMKKYVWADLKAVLGRIGRPVPPVKPRHATT
jgi:DNA polymerase